jgi:RHS repeat-associated protein
MASTTYSSGLPIGVTVTVGVSQQTVTVIDPTATLYNPGGGVNVYKTGNGVMTTVAQDSSLMQRPARISTSGASTNFDSGSYAYDGVGNILSMTVDANHVDSFTYDLWSRLKTASLIPPAGGSAVLESYAYDQWGNMTQKGATNWVIDSLTNRIKNGNGIVVGYDARGNLTNYISGNTETLTYDDLNRQIREQNTSPSNDFQYLYSGVDERLSRVPTALGNGVPRREMARFLIEAKQACLSSPPCTCAGTFTDVPCTDPDAIAIYWMQSQGITGGCTGSTFCPEAPVTRDQMAQFLLRAEHGSSYTPPACTPPGQFTDVPCPGGGFTNWIYQLVAEGITGGCTATTYCPHANTTEAQMLVFLGTLWSGYPPVAGANIVTTQGSITYCYPTTTHTYRDESDRVISEFQDTRMNRDNVYFGQLLVASMTTVWPIQSPYTESRIWEYYASDHLGTPRLVTNSSGTKIDLRKYLPYGDEMNGTGSTTQRLRFDSMERDTESNHYYDHTRDHDFRLARFVSADVLGGSVSRPPDWNLYSFVVGNPLKYVDPAGFGPCSASGSSHTDVTIRCTEEVDVHGEEVSQGGAAASVTVTASPADPNRGVSGLQDLLYGRAQLDFAGSLRAALYRSAARSFQNGSVMGILSGLWKYVIAANMPTNDRELAIFVMGAVGPEGLTGRPLLEWAAERGMTAQEFISLYRAGSINRFFPGEFLSKPVQEIMNEADSGLAAARRAVKLLIDSRFVK